MSDIEIGKRNRYYTDRGIKSQSIKDRLKACKTNFCECLREFIENAINEPHGGLRARFERMLAPKSVSSEIERHKVEINAVKRGLSEAIKLYEDNGCPSGGLPADAKQYLNMPVPTQADWEKINGRPMPEFEPASESYFDLKYWEKVTGLTGAALILFLLLWQGSRVIPARNLVPI
jgi:hypothetical protein